jgi:hypothetical protein
MVLAVAGIAAAAAAVAAAAAAAVEGMHFMQPKHQAGYVTAPQQTLACCRSIRYQSFALTNNFCSDGGFLYATTSLPSKSCCSSFT